RGVRVANVPLVPDCILPKELETLSGPLIVGLTRSAESLAEIRRNRLKILKQETETTYVDVEAVTKEVREAKRMFVRRGWPIIDVTRRSIEETAALILQLLKMHSGRQV
ncbi:MAG: kinase/pyrophosphorylase, partial [Magnetospiraceae bacterium]